jgi:hypothetical protein
MDIHDERTVADFQKFTFSGHLRAQVSKVLDENIKLGHADYTCYWVLELMCSGLVHSLWNQFFLSAAIHINRAAPQAFLYLTKSYEKFAPFEQLYSVVNMNDIRNNADARTLLCEVGASLALCRKSKLPPLPKIKPEHDFLPDVIQENLKAPSASYGRIIVRQEDPVDLYVAVNELMFCLRPETRDAERALYWMRWIMKFESQWFTEHNKQRLQCAFRSNDYVEDKYLRHPIWLIWTAVLENARTSPQHSLIYPYIDALYKMYCLRWTVGDLKKRIPFLVNAIYFVCESNSLDVH